MNLETALTRHARIEVPLICGAMYPCSNPELVAAVSEAGGIGILQPLSLVYVHGHEYREGIRYMKRLTSKPLGMNVITEKSSRAYQERMSRWLDVALEEGIRFFVTSLGNPKWIVDRVRPHGGIVYHDVTERKWALKALEGGVDGLIGVNDRAGGHTGPRTARQLLDALSDLGVPVVCAGGVGTPREFADMLAMGYAGVQLGTRFIATTECRTHAEYKQAIVESDEDDIVLTERITGIPVSVIRTPYVERIGTRAGPFARWMLRGRKTKHWMRTFYALRSLRRLKNASLEAAASADYWQAGKSVHGIVNVVPAGEVVREYAAEAERVLGTRAERALAQRGAPRAERL